MTLQVAIIATGILVIFAGVLMLLRTSRKAETETETSFNILGITLSGPTAAVVITIGVVLVLAAEPWMLRSSSAGDGVSPPPSTSRSTPRSPSSQPPASTALTAERAPITITTPTNGQQVVGAQGVTLTGTADNADDRKLWVLDHADNDKYYLVSPAPLAVINGRWSFADRHIGSESSEDDGNTFVLTVVSADETCQDAFKKAKPNNENDIVFSTLPVGCKEEAKVGVVKTS
jgi:hypothetical protein